MNKQQRREKVVSAMIKYPDWDIGSMATAAIAAYEEMLPSVKEIAKVIETSSGINAEEWMPEAQAINKLIRGEDD